MENEFPEQTTAPGTQVMANYNSCAMGQLLIPPLHVTPEMQQIYSRWEAFRGLLMLPAIACDTANDAAYAPQATLDRLSWEAIVPVAGRSLVPTLPSVPAMFAITELRGIPKAGLDHFVLATSSNGKPLYGAFVTNSQGEPRLQQLFEFQQTAINEGVFLPVPTVGRHFHGLYGLEYSRHRFGGSIAGLPPLLRWPASPTSVCLPPVPWDHQTALVQGSLHPAAAINPAPPTDHEVHDYEDSIISQHPVQSPAETPEMNAECNSIITAPPHNDCPSSSSSSSLEDAAEQQLQGVSDSSAPSSTNEAVSPLMTADERPQQRGLGPVEAGPSASGATVLAGSAQRVPERCYPCSLCAACKEFWGMPGLPDRHSQKEGFRKADEDVPAILCSEKTAARKRKWAQSRHGPKSKTSEYRGVNLYQRTWKWEAHIWHEGKQLYLGASITKTHAAQVYDRAALFLFGPDAEINFKPEGYQEEYEFMQRLNFRQMVIYMRRESRQSGEEAKYPGVAKEKGKMFCASYRPGKEKTSHEHIGYFRTEEEAVRAVLKEAKRRRNYEIAGKILDVHHVRTVKPATGKIKQRRKVRSRAARKVVQAIKVAGSNPSNRRSNRGQRAAAKPNPEIQSQAAALPTQENEIAQPKQTYVKRAANSKQSAALPTQEVLIAPPKRKYVRKVANSKQSAAAKDTAKAPLSKKAPPSQETEAAAPPKRKYIRKSTEAQDKNASKRSTQGPVPARQDIDPAPVAPALEAPPSENLRAARKRKNSATKTNSSPAAKRSASGSTALTRLQQVMAPVWMTEEAPPTSPAPLRVYRPRRCCNKCKPTPVPGTAVTDGQVLPNATQPMTVAPAAAPTSPAQIPASSAHSFMASQPPLTTYDFLSGSFKSGDKTGANYSADVEGEPSGTVPDSQDSGYASSSCLSFQSGGLTIPKRIQDSYQTPPRAVADQRIARDEEMRQFQEVCNFLVMERRSLHGCLNLRLLASASSKSPGVIRPVARRLSPRNETDDRPGIIQRDAARGVQSSLNLFPRGREGSGQLYIDLFGPSAV